MKIDAVEQAVADRFAQCKWHVIVDGVDIGCYTFEQAREKATKVETGEVYVIHEESLAKHFEKGAHLAKTEILPNGDEEPQMEICIEGGGEHAKYAR